MYLGVRGYLECLTLRDIFGKYSFIRFICLVRIDYVLSLIILIAN